MAGYNKLTLKDHIRESIIFNQRVMVASFVMGLLMLMLLIRLGYLQISNQQYYATLSEKNRVSIQPIPPTRGLIFDRNGVLLAQNLPSFTLEIIPEHVEDMEDTLNTLKNLIQISEEDLKEFETHRRKKRRFEGIPLRFRLTEEEVARVSVQQYRLPGVNINAQLSRHYPLGNLAAHAIGYVGRISEPELRKLNASNYSATTHIGKVGVEGAYEEDLHGKVGFQHVETNAAGRVLRVLDRTLPVSGKNLYLNIDSRVQAIAEKSFTSESGALVAIDPRNGAVLALVSMPGYDPNQFVHGLDAASFKALSTAVERPLFNRALRGQYPPGSTIKPLLGLAGLETDEITLQDKVDCPGWYMLKNDERRYRDWKKEGHQHTDLSKAIIESCDVFFYDLSLSLGIDRIAKYLDAFGIGKLTGIDIRGELPGLNPSREWKKRTHNMPWFPGETLITGIGQGFMLATPLQLANATAALGRMGKHYKPKIVYAKQDPQEQAMQLEAAEEMDTIAIKNPGHWQQVINAMEKVVHSIYGTARRISVNAPYHIAGKTGTAQVFSIAQDAEYKEEEIAKKLRDHALFIGFAPVEDPKIAVAVIVENGGSGGAVAAPIVRKVMDQYLVEKSDDEPA